MSIREKLVDLIYPPRCPLCHDILSAGEKRICRTCAGKLPFVRGAVCTRCGKPLAEGAGPLCHDCGQEEHFFTQGIGIFLYEDLMRKSLHTFKYQGRREYAGFYGLAACKYGGDTLRRWNPQIIMPVPVHPSRKRQRGYNQAELIGRALSGHMGIPVETGCVVRREKTKAQKELSRTERMENLRHAFAPGKKPVRWARILLVDDIYTTGSTMDAVSRILLEMGAEEIYTLSICIGKGFMVQ